MLNITWTSPGQRTAPVHLDMELKTGIAKVREEEFLWWGASVAGQEDRATTSDGTGIGDGYILPLSTFPFVYSLQETPRSDQCHNYYRSLFDKNI